MSFQFISNLLERFLSVNNNKLVNKRYYSSILIKVT